jgi:sulfur carrier protein ThiS
MSEHIAVEVWLYGPLARYAGARSQGSYAQLMEELPAGSTLGDLFARLGIPREEKGITFVNGQLAVMPGAERGEKKVLHDGDRVGISHRKSMWPFQYRLGANVTEELADQFRSRPDGGIHHAYTGEEEPPCDPSSSA